MVHSILLVDDEADVRSLLSAFLIDHGFSVHAARDGRHALQTLERMAPHIPVVILLDYQMPVMNGKQFLAVKETDPRLRDVPVIVLSAWTREWTGVGLDVVTVLPKPVDLDRLLDEVSRFARRAETGVATPP
jgi:CheY-like chemotaxis protein